MRLDHDGVVWESATSGIVVAGESRARRAASGPVLLPPLAPSCGRAAGGHIDAALRRPRTPGGRGACESWGVDLRGGSVDGPGLALAAFLLGALLGADSISNPRATYPC